MNQITDGPVRQERLGAVLVLVIDHPPVNALSHALRAGLAAGLAVAESDPAVGAVLLLAEGRSFPAGADIAELGQPAKAPTLPDLCDRIERCPKPVIAALHGTALGGGLELALAAHHRIAATGARLGFPEVSLGILPGAGGTQRLPRLVGAEQALRLMLTGKPISAAEALAIGLLDRITDHDLPAAAYAMAEAAIGTTPQPTAARRDGMRDGAAYSAAVAHARAQVRGAVLAAPHRIVDCVEAAQLLPMDQGLGFEQAAFADLVGLPEAVALRHAFFAERRAVRFPGLRARPREVNNVTVLGAEREGAEFTLALLRAGLSVTLLAADASSLVPGMEFVVGALEADVDANRLTPELRDQHWSRLTPAIGLGGISGDLVVLSAPYAQTGADIPDLPAVPVLTLGHIGAGGAMGLGLVLHPNAAAPRLAELIGRETTSPEAMATALAMLRKMGLLVVPAQGAGIGAPLQGALTAACRVLEAQHGGQAVARVLQDWGLADRAGGGRQSAGAAALYAGAGAPLIGALANAGLRLLGEGQALRPSDIDVVAMAGLGLPRWSGGPMHWAAQRGPFVLRADLEGWAALAPDLWQPAPLLAELIREGVGLSALNEG